MDFEILKSPLGFLLPLIIRIFKLKEIECVEVNDRKYQEICYLEERCLLHFI